jgi:hypothetical protein
MSFTATATYPYVDRDRAAAGLRGQLQETRNEPFDLASSTASRKLSRPARPSDRTA